MKDVEKIVGIPAGQRVFGIFALGYPDEERTQQDRFDQSRIHYVK
jgi:nitroreductase